MIKSLNNLKGKISKEKEEIVPEEPGKEEALLTEIRDLLKERSN